MAATIIKADGWAFNQMTEDFRAKSEVWREVTREFYDYCLNVLPPMDWNNGKFLICETYTDDVHACIATIGNRHFARYVPRSQANKLVDELRKLIPCHCCGGAGTIETELYEGLANCPVCHPD